MDVLAAIGWHVLDRFRFGDSLAISPHGLGIAAGYLAGSWVFLYEGRKRGYPEDAINSIIFWALVGTVIGSRLGYVFTHLSEFKSLEDVLHIERGGLSQLGGVVGAILISYVVVRRRRLPFLRGLDSVAISIPLGVVIGRVGDLIIGDHLGKPTSWLLAFTYHGGQLSGYTCQTVQGVAGCATRLSGDHIQEITARGATLVDAGTTVAQGVGVHQTALYDLFLTMLLLTVLVFLNQRARRTGVLFFTYVAWYGIGRIFTDFLRVENRFGGLTGSQWTSTIAVLFALGMLAAYAVRPERPAAVEPETVERDEPAPAG